VLPRERMLHLAECRRGGSVGNHACQPRTRLGIARIERSEPALCFLLETFEIATRWGFVAHDTFLQCARRPLSSGRRKAAGQDLVSASAKASADNLRMGLPTVAHGWVEQA